MDRNGYNPSILDTEQGICYICGAHTETARHEIFFGTANRKLSKKYGTWVNLCPWCHHLAHNNAETTKFLHIRGENAFKDKYPDIDFKSFYGRNFDI